MSREVTDRERLVLEVVGMPPTRRRLLEAVVASRSPLRLRDVARATGVFQAHASPHMVALEGMGLVLRSVDRTYSPSPAAGEVLEKVRPVKSPGRLDPELGASVLCMARRLSSASIWPGANTIARTLRRNGSPQGAVSRWCRILELVGLWPDVSSIPRRRGGPTRRADSLLMRSIVP